MTQQKLRPTLALLIAVSLTVLLAGCTKEPSYQGKSLTEWLIRRWNGLMDESGDDGSGAALKAIGTNAVPSLLRLVEAPRAKKSDVGLFTGSGHKAVYTNALSPAVQRELAWIGFATLGTNGMCAAPNLIKLARHKNASVRIAALSCFKAVRPEKQVGLPVTAAALRDVDALVEMTAARFIHDRYPEEMARLGVAAQMKRLTKSIDKDVRKKAFDCLDSLGLNRDEMLGTLTSGLRDADGGVKWQAGKILAARFPSDAERLGVYKMFPELRTPGMVKGNRVVAGR